MTISLPRRRQAVQWRLLTGRLQCRSVQRKGFNYLITGIGRCGGESPDYLVARIGINSRECTQTLLCWKEDLLRIARLCLLPMVLDVTAILQLCNRMLELSFVDLEYMVKAGGRTDAEIAYLDEAVNGRGRQPGICQSPLEETPFSDQPAGCVTEMGNQIRRASGRGWHVDVREVWDS